MQRFVVICGEQGVHARYPDKKDMEILEEQVHELFQEDVSRFPDVWTQAKTFMEKKEVLRCIPLLHELVQSFNNSYAAFFALGEALQMLRMFYQSTVAFVAAWDRANHAFFKLQATSRKMLSWKKLGDDYYSKNRLPHAASAYMNGAKAYAHAQKWTYAATAPEAAALEYTHASLLCQLVALAVKSEQNAPEVRLILPKLWNYARAAKELSEQVSEHYDRQEMKAHHANLETSLQNIEKKQKL